LGERVRVRGGIFGSMTSDVILFMNSLVMRGKLSTDSREYSVLHGQCPFFKRRFQKNKSFLLRNTWATLMSFPLVGNLSEEDRKDCGQAAMTKVAGANFSKYRHCVL
jgi:hypothetical protein